MRIYKNRWFDKFARREGITDLALCAAIRRAENGMIDADLGGGLIKQRVAREGAGKSSGFRTLIIYRSGEMCVFTFGFAKNDRANLNRDELVAFKKAAKIVVALTEAQIETEVTAGRLMEVQCGDDI